LRYDATRVRKLFMFPIREVLSLTRGVFSSASPLALWLERSIEVRDSLVELRPARPNLDRILSLYQLLSAMGLAWIEYFGSGARKGELQIPLC
jgi:hypothetical protein